MFLTGYYCYSAIHTPISSIHTAGLALNFDGIKFTSSFKKKINLIQKKIKMIKVILVFVVTIVVTTLLLSCKKNNSPAPITITGYWTGTLNNITPVGFLFDKNGYLKTYNLNYGDTATAAGQGSGTYTISDSTVHLTFEFMGMMRPSHLTGISKTNKEGNLMTGTCTEDVRTVPMALKKN